MGSFLKSDHHQHHWRLREETRPRPHQGETKQGETKQGETKPQPSWGEPRRRLRTWSHEMKNKKPAKHRKINTIGSQVGKHRENLYKEAYHRINSAKEHGYWLEVIAICDSIIGDRFEALVAAIKNQIDSGRKFRTISQIIENHGPKIVKNGFPQSVIDELEEWVDHRNRFMHEIVKVRDNEISSWEDRIKLAKETAETGIKHSRKIDKITRPIIINIRKNSGI